MTVNIEGLKEIMKQEGDYHKGVHRDVLYKPILCRAMLKKQQRG